MVCAASGSYRLDSVMRCTIFNEGRPFRHPVCLALLAGINAEEKDGNSLNHRCAVAVTVRHGSRQRDDVTVIERGLAVETPSAIEAW